MPDRPPPRPDTLPEDAVAYRNLGPFDEASLPAGLLTEHRLKAGTWGLLTIESGEIAFLWDDDPPDGRDQPDARRLLRAGDRIVVPPQVPHHLAIDGPFRLTLTFYRAE